MEVLSLISTTIPKKREVEGNARPLKRPSTLRRLASTRGFRVLKKDERQTSAITVGLSGWVRVYSGPVRDSYDEKSRVVYLTHSTTSRDVCRDMLLSPDLAIWMQIGGGPSKRLSLRATPLALQDDFLKKIGYNESSRRARLGVDPELRHLLRFHIGPAVPSPTLFGLRSCGSVQVLKGLVFPQWRRRTVAIVGSRMSIYPGCPDGAPEIWDLSDGDVDDHPPKSGRLLLRVAPRTLLPDKGTPPRHAFLGFDYAWEKDMWRDWLIEATEHRYTPQRVDLSNADLQGLPDNAVPSVEVEELCLGHNDLGAGSLDALIHLHRLKTLRLPYNGLQCFPRVLMQLSTVVCLDLSDNNISALPTDICLMTSLEDLFLDRNDLQELPNSLSTLTRLLTLQVAENRISVLPQFLILKMRAPPPMDIITLQNEVRKENYDDKDKNDLNPPLTKVSLRANQLKGNIILGNYGNLTQLDVSENFIETLDLTALDKLEVLQCSRNKIIELSVNGRVLNSLIAGNNELRKLIVSPPPASLRHLDVSFNCLTELPCWVSSCHELRALFASNNNLSVLPEHLLCSELSSLYTIQLGYNRIQKLPSLPRRRVPLQEIFLQSNCIASLPDNFFTSCKYLRVLNLSNNRLTHLPELDGICSNLEKLYLTANCLTDKAMDTLTCFPSLRILHAAYNCLTTVPESCVESWSDLEELVLSGNRLQNLPENLATLSHLTILRVHSNRLQTAPGFSNTRSLRILDLAHNQLDRINLVSLVPRQLQFLDLSCNSQLHVDPRQFQACKSQRPMSLVDVSGRNRSSLPSTPWPYNENSDSHLEPPWKIGFSETAGNQQRLFISQLRLPAFCNTEGLFGIFDGEINNDIPNILLKAVPKILLEERTVKETANDYMKYTLLSAHRELKERGQKYGVCATLCHITRSRLPEINFIPTGRRYVLRVASVGEATAILSRPSGPVRLTPSTPRRQIGNSAKFPLVIPDPEVAEITLSEQDEFVILANKRLWEVVSMESAIEEVRAQENTILAAKRLQDLAQSYGAEDNLSVMVIRFCAPGTDVDQLMRELRHTIRKKPVNGSATSSELCKCGCCCDMQNNCCHSIGTGLLPRQNGSDRSSPSGQSDQAVSDCMSTRQPIVPVIKETPKLAILQENKNRSCSAERRSIRGMARAAKSRIEEEREREDTDSALSEEQFKCWEYMLEQNTQLLFDKELNTLTRGFPKRPAPSTLRSQRSLSSSSPHLAATPPTPTNPPFLSRHFGSARNFTPASLKPAMRFGSGRALLNGGPHAAYFGSLQRLMPYNLEYDFAGMRERGSQADSLEHDNRMQQYWGVATTEL